MEEQIEEAERADPLAKAFFEQLFIQAVRRRKGRPAENGWELFFSEEYGELSRRVDKSGLQDSVSVRNVLRTRQLAKLLIDEQGQIDETAVAAAIEALEGHLCSLGADRQYDFVRNRHILNVLYLLLRDKEVGRAIRKLSKPYGLKQADQLIRDTLALPSQLPIGDRETRQAVLAAWLCYLRQKVGSCFATAPAILIHDEQPLAFLRDLEELLSTGRLKRTFGGIEYMAPLSPSWGAGELRKPCLVARDGRLEKGDLWLSPGLLAALEAAELIDRQKSLRDKLLRCRQLVLGVLERWRREQGYGLLFVTAERLIQQLLMEQLKLTQEELKDYEKRPLQLIQGALLHQLPASAVHSGGKGEVCAHYQLLLERAQVAFKQLADNALLKAWEFTVASFAETKATFSRWNFYASLGLNSDDVGGIGPTIYRGIQEKLEEANQQVQEHQERYEQVYSQVRHLEVRLRRADEQEIGWLRSELRSLVNEFRTVEQLRDKAQRRAQQVAGLYQLLMELYSEAFPRYFQEVYDANIQEVRGGPYDDSPAGFRLLYKYGRSNSSQWTAIYTSEEFIEMLVNFFLATETELLHADLFEGIETVIREIVSLVVAHVRTPEFLESALVRMARQHGGRLVADPLNQLEQLEKKPWVYTSGGSMSSLVSCYFGLEGEPKSVSRWVESPLELLVFLVDLLKDMQEADRQRLSASLGGSMLIHSPTHAFLFKPLSSLLQEAMHGEGLTYTWVRDHLVSVRQRFIDNIVLDEAKMAFLVDQLADKAGAGYAIRFRDYFTPLYGTMSPLQFRSHLLEGMELDNGLQRAGRAILSPEEIDALLYEQLPLVAADHLPKVVEEILEELKEAIETPIKQRALALLDGWMPSSRTGRVLGAEGVCGLVKGLLLAAMGKTSLAIDLHLLVSRAMQRLGYGMPEPIVFADTNWERELFGFVVNPGNGELELWRVDYTGRVGSPMAEWRPWLDGSRRAPPWGVYTRPQEYLR